LFALRNRINADSLIWDTDMAKIMQLLHAEGIRNGITYQWLSFFEPEQDILDEYERLSNPNELEDL
jgi:hypothetical protein